MATKAPGSVIYNLLLIPFVLFCPEYAKGYAC